MAVLVIRLLRLTVRPETIVQGSGDRPELRSDVPPPIFAFFHGRQLPLLCWRYPRGLAVMVSHSRDGALQARVLALLGFAVVRGSESRDAIAGLRGVLRRVGEEERGAAFAVDGGRGPLHTVHPGVLLLAQHSGRSIVPVGAAVRRRRVLKKTWDRYQIPHLFSPAAVVLGEPLEVPRRATRAEREALAATLSERLHAATADADAACGAEPDPGEPGPRGCARCWPGQD
ncbi:MAG: lysophospholipid acyltransferase family protein [Deltaproteobacteria bacterium]|nr:lysophospholipid acyltransferase family protein [Deltaproteobacteria bacterium]